MAGSPVPLASPEAHGRESNSSSSRWPGSRPRGGMCFASPDPVVQGVPSGWSLPVFVNERSRSPASPRSPARPRQRSGKIKGQRLGEREGPGLGGQLPVAAGFPFAAFLGSRALAPPVRSCHKHYAHLSQVRPCTASEDESPVALLLAACRPDPLCPASTVGPCRFFPGCRDACWVTGLPAVPQPRGPPCRCWRHRSLSRPRGSCSLLATWTHPPRPAFAQRLLHT